MFTDTNNDTNNNYYRNNGRVVTRQPPDIRHKFALMDRIPVNQCATYRDPLVGQWEDTALSRAYFSKDNIQIIQNAIRAGIYERSNHQYVIGNQDCDSLKIIMRSVYLSYAMNQPTRISQQIAELNAVVVEYCIHHVYSEAKGYMKYLHDINTLAMPLATPQVERQKDKTNYKLPAWF